MVRHSLQSTGAKAAQSELHEWGLGDRRFGMVVSWFLIGGDLYTAYTFYAVSVLEASLR